MKHSAEIQMVRITRDTFLESSKNSKFLFNQFTTDLSSNLFVFFSSIAPDQYIPAHIHPAPNDTYVHIITGHVRHYYGEKLENSMDNEAGDLVRIAPETPHQPTNLSKEEPVLAIVFCNYDQNDPLSAIPYDQSAGVILHELHGIDLATWGHKRHVGPYS